LKTLESKDNPRIRQLAKLAESPRETAKQGLALLDGVHLIQALLQSGHAPSWGVVTPSAQLKKEIREALHSAESQGTEWFEIPETLLTSIAPTEHPSGILAVWPYPQAQLTDPHLIPKDACVLMLEEIQDPGNLGTLLRSAHASGIEYVALSAGCAEAWAPKVLRAAMGAHFYVRIIQHIDLIELARDRIPTYATAADGAVSAWHTDLNAAKGIVIGNEGAGISRLLREACTTSIALPMHPSCESLNAGVAGSILMFERQRQLQLKT